MRNSPTFVKGSALKLARRSLAERKSPAAKCVDLSLSLPLSLASNLRLAM